MNEELLTLGIEALIKAPRLLKNCGLLPNINYPTLGGWFFWNDIVSYKGWRIQQNTITQHYRILDPTNFRRGWAFNEEALVDFFEKIVSASA